MFWYHECVLSSIQPCELLNFVGSLGLTYFTCLYFIFIDLYNNFLIDWLLYICAEYFLLYNMHYSALASLTSRKAIIYRPFTCVATFPYRPWLSMATSLVHEEKIVPRGLHSYQLFEQEGHFLVFNVLVHLRLIHVCNSPKFHSLPCSCSTCINVSLVIKSC